MESKNQKAYYVQIGLKKEFFDAFGQDVLNSIGELGMKGIEKVYVYDVYRVYGEVTLALVKKIAKELFLDPVAHEMSVYELKNEKKSGLPSIEVWYKPGVTDPVALTALKGISDLGISGDIRVSCGKKYEFKGDLITKVMLENIAKKILSNTLIQDFIIKGI
ncbi:MAG: phosphoribosylformylglycinamidine synthase subunit PurS [bacterium]|nr:phosphoribosylformylglycinamidine synthase subunit PurS [bacterium]